MERLEAIESDLIRTMFTRSSYRKAFKDEAVPREDLELIMEAGIMAPSGCNRQSSTFVAVTEPEKLKAVKKIFTFHQAATAPAFIMVFTQEIESIDHHCYNVEDYAASIQNMLLTIKLLGYESCWYEGMVRDHADELAAIVGAPEEVKLIALLPVGKAAEAAPEPAKRKDFAERAWFDTYRG